ncbi:MAG TPA: hypothetical protein VK586_10360 [Streptosporangiaceae bacterium]|nr:hypothetical protein [Streptosporangiaceae bacterium]
MSHVSSPVLRRLQDEPLAVPDAARRHLAACARCQASNSKIAQNAALAARVLAPPAAAPDDTSLAWARLQASEPATRRATVRVPRPRPRIASMSLGTGTIAVAGVLVAGTGAAVALTTVYAPTHVAPVRVSQDDFRAISTIASIGGTRVTDGLPPAGHQQLPFGELSWTAAGKASPVTSVAQARALTGLPLAAPRTLPAGVGAPRGVVVQPKVTVTVRFSASAGSGVAGSTLVITGGPGALVQYGGTAAGRAQVTTMVIAEMQRPVATSTGAATAAQLEAFLLAAGHLPASLAQEIRLLGTAALPVPVPAGIAEQHVSVGGSAAVLLADPSGAAAGVIWEGSDGVVHGVGGLLDREDVLNVARQLG